jgi:hypothetical protein
LAFEPSRELAQWINEFSIEVLDAPLNLALVLRIRRMSKLSLDPMLTAPVLPLLLKLAAMIRKYSLRKPLLPLQNSHSFRRSQLMVKLLRRNNEPAIVIDANQKPVFLSLNGKWTFEVYLPKLIRLFGSEEFPAFKLMIVAVLIVLCEDVVYDFSREHYALNTIHRFQNEAWQVAEALLYAGCSPSKNGS